MSTMPKYSEWKNFFGFINKRIKDPFKSPRFILYFVFIIMVLGSMGIFYELYTIENGCLYFKHWGSVVINMANISLAYIAASSVELILLNEDETKFKEVNLKDVQMFGVSVLILGFILWILSVLYRDELVSFIFSGLGLFLAYFLWWISNSEKPQLNQVDPKTILGNINNEDVNNELEGTTDEFKS